ncbi:MAG: hypothetical protein ACJA06_001720 [Halocynthiibacter sp.]|jgi:hypothetical protein
MIKFIDQTSLGFFALAAFTLGLAPFAPPHLWEKLGMLFTGALGAPMDIFDLALHGAPWLFFIAKIVRVVQAKRAEKG